MIFPPIKETQTLLKSYSAVPLFYEVFFDSYTATHIFKALQTNAKNAFMLESAYNNQSGRYSFLGFSPKEEVIIKDKKAIIKDRAGNITKTETINNLQNYLNNLLSQQKVPTFENQPHLTGGYIGYFGYDICRYVEPILQSSTPPSELELADCNLFLYDELIVVDHFTNHLIFIQYVYQNQDIEAAYKNINKWADTQLEKIQNYQMPVNTKTPKKEMQISSNLSKETYFKNIEKAKQYIKDGDIFQVVPSQRFTIKNPPSAFAVYRQLRKSNPSPYLYYFKTDNYEIVGSSPEMLVSVTGQKVMTKPIAGTRPRGATPEKDLALQKSLLGDAKEKAEHSMLVDLGRNDLGRISQIGSVEVTEFMNIEKYSTVMHIVSEIEGKLKEKYTAVDALLSVLPAGTLSGAPKIRAMQIIDELEPVKREVYGGAIGYLDFSGNMNTCIAIRTLVFKNNCAYVQAGGGIVYDSNAEDEYQESYNKANATLRAVEKAFEAGE